MDQKLLQILSAKLFTREITEEEKNKLDALIALSDENKIEFEKMSKIWNSAQANEISAVPDVELEWQKLERKIESAAGEPFLQKLTLWLAPLLQPKLKPAIGISFMVLLIFSGLLYFGSKPDSPRKLQIAAENGEIQQIILSDGSSVKLNSGSVLEFPDEFTGEKREVNLSGEGFFIIAKDRLHPFVVKTKNAATTVLGTQFNVWNRGTETRVIVREGTVRLSSVKNESGAVILTQNQFSEIIGDGVPKDVQPIDAGRMLGWLDGKFVFDETPLAEIVGELERHFNAKIELPEGDIQSETVTASFNNNKLEDILEMLSITLGVKIEKNDNVYYLKE